MSASLPSLPARRALAAAAVVLGAALAPSSASAAGQPFTCEASVLRGTVLTSPPIEPVVTNRGKPCATTRAGAPDASALPLPLSLGNTLTATTTLTGPAGQPAQQTASAAGGVADLSIGSLASLGLSLPLDQVALPPQVQPVTVDISQVTGPLNALGGGLPTSLTVDISGAVKALLALPQAKLLDVAGAVAKASASCQNGALTTSSSRRTAGVSVLGHGIDLNTTGNQPIIDTQSINPAAIDPNTIQLPVVAGLAPGAQAAVNTLVRTALGNALKALPPLSVPITLGQVQVTPGTQTKTATGIEQTALDVKIAIAGHSVVNLTVGDAKVDAAGVQCAASATAAQTALQCTKRKLVLIDVLQRRKRVAIYGVADKRYVGRRVGIRFRADGHIVAHAKVAKNGTFRTTAALPRRSLRGTNSARYQAVLGKQRSLDLKLQRRMTVTKLVSAKGKVRISGFITRPLASPARSIRLVRRVSCRKSVVVKRFRPRSDGTFSVTVKAPKGLTAAVYRLATQVRKNTRNPKLYPTFTLPRGVDLKQ